MNSVQVKSAQSSLKHTAHKLQRSVVVFSQPIRGAVYPKNQKIRKMRHLVCSNKTRQLVQVC